VGTPRARSLAELPYNFWAYVVGFSLGPTVGELHRMQDLAWIFGTFPEILPIAVIVGTLFGVAILNLRGNKPATAIVLPWAVGLPLLVFTVSIVTGQTFNVRYALPGLPGFVILLAIGTQSFSRRVIRHLAAAAVILVFTVSLASYYWNPHYDKAHVREATRTIRASNVNSIPVAFVGGGVDVVEHYGPSLNIWYPILCGGDLGSHGWYGIEKLRVQNSFWLMASRDWSNRSIRCLDLLKSTHHVAERESLVGVELWRFERTNGSPSRSP